VNREQHPGLTGLKAKDLLSRGFLSTACNSKVMLCLSPWNSADSCRKILWCSRYPTEKHKRKEKLSCWNWSYSVDQASL